MLTWKHDSNVVHVTLANSASPPTAIFEHIYSIACASRIPCLDNAPKHFYRTVGILAASVKDLTTLSCCQGVSQAVVVQRWAYLAAQLDLNQWSTITTFTSQKLQE